MVSVVLPELPVPPLLISTAPNKGPATAPFCWKLMTALVVLLDWICPTAAVFWKLMLPLGCWMFRLVMFTLPWKLVLAEFWTMTWAKLATAGTTVVVPPEPAFNDKLTRLLIPVMDPLFWPKVMLPPNGETPLFVVSIPPLVCSTRLPMEIGCPRLAMVPLRLISERVVGALKPPPNT